MLKLRASYRPHPDYEEGGDQPQLLATLDLSNFGVEMKVTHLPIYFRRLERPLGPIRQVYRACIAGLTLEKGNLNRLEETIDLYLNALIHFGLLPEYVFQVGDKAWPIYHLPEQLVTRYPGSSFFSAPDIATLRIALADHFKLTGEIINRKEMGVLRLSRTDLQLYPFVCTLRGPKMFDIPIFPVNEEEVPHLVAPVNARNIAVPLEGGLGILKLHQRVADYLVTKGKLEDPRHLSIRKLSAATWTQMQSALTPYGRYLAYYDNCDGRLVKQQAPVFKNGRLMVAARTNHLGRTALQVAPDIWNLQAGLGHELYNEGKLSSPNYVTVHDD